MADVEALRREAAEARKRRRGAMTGKPGQQVRPELAHRPGREVALNEMTLRALRPHAVRRDLRTHALAQLIIEAVVDGDLVDAVLDDRETHHGQH